VSQASFRYIAIGPDGKRVSGVASGAGVQAVLAELESRKLVPVSVTEKKDSGGMGGVVRLRSGVPTRRLAGAYTQLGDLLKAGVPILRALRLVAGQKASPKLASVFSAVSDKVADGSDLAAAMEQREDVFPAIHVAMVRAGERGGFLDSVLARLGEMMEKQADLRGKLIGSLIYPAVLVTFGLAALVAIFGFLVPKTKPLYARVQLGSLTRGVFWIADNVRMLLPAVAVLVAVGVVTGWRMLKRPAVRERFDAAVLAVPLVGPAMASVSIARLCRVQGTMLANSIPMLTALQIARDSAGSTVFGKVVDAQIEAVRQGQPMARVLGESGVFPDDVVETIAVGESANNLDDVLLGIAERLEKKTDQQLSVIVRLIEPLMLVLIAGIIGLVAIALVVPLSKVGQTI
jgi:general secretion pathway protein F